MEQKTVQSQKIILLRRRESAVARLLANKPHHLIAFGIEDYHRDAKREVFEVMAHTEPVLRHGVIHHKLIHLRAHILQALVHVVP